MINPNALRGYSNNNWPDDLYVVSQASGTTGYDGWGYMAVVRGNEAAIGRYDHCSCFGTWTALGDGWSWEGIIDEMIDMARRNADPDMEDREAKPEDFDYAQLLELYHDIVEWDRKGRSLAGLRQSKY